MLPASRFIGIVDIRQMLEREPTIVLYGFTFRLRVSILKVDKAAIGSRRILSKSINCALLGVP